MISQIAVRPMQTGEEPAWASMRSRLWRDCGPEDNKADLAQLRDPQGALKVVFLAIANGQPMGFAEISERSVVDGADHRPAAYLEGWYVEPAWRRRGLGALLVNAAADWAREQGYAFFGSDAELANTLSHKAHEALGFEETGRVVRYLMALTP